MISPESDRTGADASIGRIVSVTGAKAIVLLDSQASRRPLDSRPEMGTLLAIDTVNTVVLAIVSALSVPMPAQRDGDRGVDRGARLVGELGVGRRLAGQLQPRRDRLPRARRPRPRRLQARARACVLRRRAAIGARRHHPPGQLDPADGPRRRPARQAFRHPRHNRHGQVVHDGADPARHRREEPNAHIVLLDPHNEYATSFGDWAEVISPRNMQLPFWLLNFEEIVEVLVGDPSRKAEIEILQELIPMAKSRYSSGRAREGQNLRRGALDASRFTVDTPVPYRVSDLTSLIDERMGKLENKKDLAPYRQLKARIDAISQDGRYAFMFGSLTVYDGMTQVLGRIFRVPVNSHRSPFSSSPDCRPRSSTWWSRAVPPHLRLRLVERGPGAGDARVRGGAPLRAGECGARVRTVPARDRQDRQGGTQVRGVAVRGHAAPRRDRPDHPLSVQHDLRAAHVERSRPADRPRRFRIRARA